MGRKSKLTPDTEKRLLDLIRAGVPKKRAAEACGMHEATFYRRVADNASFAGDVEKAYGECVASKVLRVRKAEDDSWQAAAWWLERRERADFGRVDRHEVTGKDGSPVTVHFFIPDNEREDAPEYRAPGAGRNGNHRATARAADDLLEVEG